MAGAVIASAVPVEDAIVRMADIVVAPDRVVVITAVQGQILAVIMVAAGRAVEVDPAPAPDRVAVADPAAADRVAATDLVVATGAKQLLRKQIAQCNRKRWNLTVPPLLFLLLSFCLVAVKPMADVRPSQLIRSTICATSSSAPDTR
jgi:hypothetical protein